MIKRGPSCNRTYSDESISFCLADGALLSAPEVARHEAAPTEILTAGRVEVPATQPAKPAVSTLSSLPTKKYRDAGEVGAPSENQRRAGFAL